MRKSIYFSSFLAFGLFVSSTTLSASELGVDSDFPSSLVADQNTTHGIQSAWYSSATTRYAHGVLGDAVEAGSLHAKTVDGRSISMVLDQAHVFEDIQPRLADLDGDGTNEVVTIRSHNQKGGQIAVYGVTRSNPNKLSLITTTPYIGQAYRWLAPIGIADFDKDGSMEVAYIDRPHLAKILRVWRYRDGNLEQVAQTQGLTNHKIGDDYITGGVHTCNGKASMITVDSNWSSWIKTTFTNGTLVSKDIGNYTDSNRVAILASSC